jgi:hypothetical protein
MYSDEEMHRREEPPVKRTIIKMELDKGIL